MALIKTKSRGIADNAVGAAAIDLTANYAFTGTHTTPNNFVLLESTTDTSNVNYDSDVDILDFTSHVSTYRQFFYTIDYMPTSGGNYHLHQYFANAGTNNKINGRVICNGRSDTNVNVSPDTGTDTYLRTCFTTAGPGIAAHIQGTIYNGRRSDADYDCGVMGQTNFHYSGVGNCTCTFSFMATASAAEGIGKIGFNLDGVGHSNNNLGKVTARLWGVA